MSKWIGFFICQLTIYFYDLVISRFVSNVLLGIACIVALYLVKVFLYHLWISRFCTLENGEITVSFFKRWLGFFIASISSEISVIVSQSENVLIMYATLIFGCIAYYIWVSCVATEVALENMRLEK